MNFDAIKPIADAILYEGYLLYPYRASSLKNQKRFMIGGLLPKDYCDQNGNLEPFSLRSECLFEASTDGNTALAARVHFLHTVKRTTFFDSASEVFEEATERQIVCGPLQLKELLMKPHAQTFSVAAGCAQEGNVKREHQAVCGSLKISAEEVAPNLFKLTVQVQNLTPMPSLEDEGAARLRTLASTHVLLGIEHGAFISLLDPPDCHAAQVERCKQSGAWPILVGNSGRRDLVLCSPIILYDYPVIAKETPGDLFDSTEIDEILRLRILTLTAEEKRELAATDERARKILEQTSALSPDELLRLHGRHALTLKPGDRVRLRPGGRSDIFDLALAGKTAIVASIEQDFEDRLFVTVTLDDDPGRDLGISGQPGHRFFFRPDEVERISDIAEAR